MAPSLGLHEGLAPKGWKGPGEECAPPVGSWPLRTRTTRTPPHGRRGAAPGDQGGACGEFPLPPTPPPPLSPLSRPVGGAASPQEGRGTPEGDATAAASAAARQAPPVEPPITPSLPAADRRLRADAVGSN